MKFSKAIFLFTALLIIFGNAALFAIDDIKTETRNIYIGDIIVLEITTREYSRDELIQKFIDFETVEIKSTPGGYNLSIRTFEPGERSILIGDKELIIRVSSTLDDIEREDIFEGELKVLKPGFAFPWRVLFFMSLSVFILSGAFIIYKTFIKKQSAEENPYKLFLRRSAALSDEDENYFVDLTFYFKEYVGSLFKRRIIGKTSTEIVNELSEIPALKNELFVIEKWLSECDLFKFAGIEITSDDKRSHYTRLLSIAESLEAGQSAAEEVAV